MWPTTISFDLWMSRFRHDTFILVINFINSMGVPCHVVVGPFQATNTFGVAMIVQVKDLLSSYNLLDKLITCVKDENDNLCIHAQAFALVVNCGLLGLVVPWKGSCFGHAFNKLCQYACNDTKIYVGFKEVNLKATQFTLQKKTWTKKYGKGCNECHKACLDVGLSHRKLKTLMKHSFTTKAILF